MLQGCLSLWWYLPASVISWVLSEFPKGLNETRETLWTPNLTEHPLLLEEKSKTPGEGGRTLGQDTLGVAGALKYPMTLSLSWDKMSPQTHLCHSSPDSELAFWPLQHQGQSYLVVGQLGRGSSPLWWDAVGTRVWDKGLAWQRIRQFLLPPAPAFRWGYVRGLGLRTLDKGLLFMGLNFHWLAKPKWMGRLWPVVSLGEHGEPCPHGMDKGIYPYHICLRSKLQVPGGQPLLAIRQPFTLRQEISRVNSGLWGNQSPEMSGQMEACCHRSIFCTFVLEKWVTERNWKAPLLECLSRYQNEEGKELGLPGAVLGLLCVHGGCSTNPSSPGYWSDTACAYG
jgi:hypothetical protein